MTLRELDRATPVLKHEMEGLSALARKIVAVLACMPKGSHRVKDIAQRSRTPENIASVYLGRLVKSGQVVRSVGGYSVRADLGEWLRFRRGLIPV